MPPKGFGRDARNHPLKMWATLLFLVDQCSAVSKKLAMSILTYILGWPLIAAIVLVFVPRNYRVIIRAVALLATFVSMLLAVKMFCQFVTGHVGYQFEQQIPWVESLGISYHVGVDGLNVGLILMGAIVAFAAACCSFEIQSREKEFYILLLVMTGELLGDVRVAGFVLLLFPARTGVGTDVHHDWRLGPRARREELRHVPDHALSERRRAHCAYRPHRALPASAR